MTEKIGPDRLARLRPLRQGHAVLRGLVLPENHGIYSDPEAESFVVLGPDRVLVAERKWETVNRWRRKGETMGFVARHEPRTRTHVEGAE